MLVYLPRERYSAAVVQSLAQALKASSGASEVLSQTLVYDGPLARVYLIAQGARNPLDLEAAYLDACQRRRLDEVAPNS